MFAGLGTSWKSRPASQMNSSPGRISFGRKLITTALMPSSGVELGWFERTGNGFRLTEAGFKRCDSHTPNATTKTALRT